MSNGKKKKKEVIYDKSGKPLNLKKLKRKIKNKKGTLTDYMKSDEAKKKLKEIKKKKRKEGKSK